jgi:hypothetical protein
MSLRWEKKRKKNQLASDQRAGVGAFGNKICHFVGKKKGKKVSWRRTEQTVI